MELFDLLTPATLPEAIRAQGAFIAGGTNLIDLMKLNVERPTHLVDINTLPLTAIESLPDGSLKIGALARNADVAHHPIVQQHYAVLSEAILAGASAQLRNMATTSGNLLQKTRCLYFRDTASPCNKRNPGSGCAAIGGVNRSLAVLGTSDHCIATNPSDQNVALAALEATIHITGARVARSETFARSVPIADFYLLPGNTPHKETVLEPGDLITSITLPAPKPGTKSLYLKLRDRASYEFALASAAVVISQNASGHIDHIRIALGGVGTRPWRAVEAEQHLLGKAPTAANLRAAADAALASAKPQSQNAFKIELAKRCLTHAITQATQSV